MIQLSDKMIALHAVIDERLFCERMDLLFNFLPNTFKIDQLFPLKRGIVVINNIMNVNVIVFLLTTFFEGNLVKC